VRTNCCVNKSFESGAAQAASANCGGRLAWPPGDVIVLMDGDGQNDPSDIQLCLKIDDGNDLRLALQSPGPVSPRLPSMIAIC
jgi:hypothetical protein